MRKHAQRTEYMSKTHNYHLNLKHSYTKCIYISIVVI